MRQKKDRIPLGGIAPGEAPRALAAVLKARGFAESAAPEGGSVTPKQAEAPIELAAAGKLVLRRERKGRGGKTVTLLSGLTLPAARLELLARALRKGLGCGATVEQGSIVLQGDLVERAREWLEKHGASKVVAG
jgi:translation initiation factor 1